MKRFKTIAHPPDKKRRLEKRERKRRLGTDDNRSPLGGPDKRSHTEQRNADEGNSPIIHLPFQDKEWDNNQRGNEPAQTGNTMDEQSGEKNLTEQEKERLAALKSMLDASNARYQQATRNRRPLFAAGLEVKVINGEHAGKIGLVLDADYIENRALISLADQESPRWIGFRSLGHAD